MTKDYSVIMQDSIGRTVVLYINGASVDEMGGNEMAREKAESNAFQSVVASGEIGDDAFVVSYN